ncbi:16S rRNA processing protein RimM [Methylobacterium nodulans ORS 2060]|uniref:Ribosome maturation factor RimM n=1 Tax=Methylobacterium nodulans (strain LMG 21967 / CNCM I-2342 / ORS 2060) TaxID=460265 RepID=RIMM_METNO|nr:RecName: Full=Ribosome maturation factor RimM [Methylobacterium nodulans ORS 2060]ACL57840.1 16S rRNA processing protein RimM [Methylobacterium nodulans ORS 2060]
MQRDPAGAPRPAGASAAAPDLAGDPAFVLLGEFGRAHGLQGEVRLKSYTADPMAIGSYGPLTGANGRAIALTALRPASGAPDMLIARVSGVSGRDAAEALNRLALYVRRECLGAPEDEDEFFSADLIGLAVVDAAGTRLGTIRAVPNYGGGDLLEIEPTGGGAAALLPFTRAFVPKVDIAAREVTIDPPDDLFAPAKPSPEDEV